MTTWPCCDRPVAPRPTGSVPAYLQLAADLADRCEQLPGGSRLPSEHELAAEHGVSRITARAALQELEQRHVVRRRRGSGTFVASRIPYPVRAGMAPSWTAIVNASGHTACHRLESVETVRAPAAVSRALLMPPGRRVVRIERLGLVDGELATHQVSHVPATLVPNLAERLGHGSLTSTLTDHYDLVPDRWWSRAEMVTVPDEVARRLDLVGRPMAWHIESVNVCRRSQHPIELTNAWLRADHFQVRLEFGPSDGELPPPPAPT